ncbi:MAG: DNA-formamidopyrimidine glycosylase family protein [Spirochaetaceae bacterium]
MPELPDVEIQRRFLERHALGRVFEDVEITDAEKVLTGTTEPKLRGILRGASITGTQRLGKYLLTNLSDGEHTLVLHFGMTGYLVFQEGGTLFVAGGTESGGGERSFQTAELPEKTKGVFACSDGGRLGYVNMRLLGSIFLVRDIAAFRRAHGIGPDALSLSREEFRQLLTGRGSAKSTLMNQKKLSGIGNVYSDEILFQAGIHPQRKLSELSREERDRIYEALRMVMETAIQRDADPAKFPETFLTPYRSSGTGPDRRHRAEEIRTGDGWLIEKAKIGGRGAFFSPEKQK